MSLVHPVIEPQIALRACIGNFFSTSQEWVALLYSNRIVFTPTQKPASTPTGPPTESEDDEGEDANEEISISIPRPPMTLGSEEEETGPNLGGLFFSVGRNHDMLAMQYGQALVILSINVVDRLLELQGIWGLPKLKDQLNGHNRRPGHSRATSAVNLLNLAEQASTSSSSSSSSSIHNGVSGPGRSGLSLSTRTPAPRPSPDGTSIFLATRNKYQGVILLVLSCYGKETIRMDVDYVDILTLGWLTDDHVYFVYMNAKFHKKFQVCRLANKAKATGFLGMGRKAIKPSFLFEVNVPLGLDFQPSVQDYCGGPDIVFKEYVLLGTRKGGYIRVNHRAGSWEPVPNAKNVVAAVRVGETALLVQATTPIPGPAPTHSSQFTFAVVADGTVHALRAKPEIGACLSSKHNIEGDRRFVVKLLHLGGGYLLDYKRQPFRLYRYQSKPTGRMSVVDQLPSPPQSSTKLTRDFLVKTEQALYTRDPNGDDSSIRKIVSRENILDILLERPGLSTLERRDTKSVYACFTSTHGLPPEIVILDESHTKPDKMKPKAKFDFGVEFNGLYADWHIYRVKALHRNVVLVTMTSRYAAPTVSESTWVDEFSSEWAIFLLVFVGSTSKRDRVPPAGHLLMKSRSPETPPEPFPIPGNHEKFTIHTYNAHLRTFTQHFTLDVSVNGQHKMTKAANPVVPFAMDQKDGVCYFTDYNGPLDGVFMAGTYNSSNKVSNVLLVDSPGASDGNSIALPGSDPFKTTIWNFDANGLEFREFTISDIPDVNSAQSRFELLKTQQRKHATFKDYDISPEFHTKQFAQASANNDFRPLPELSALVCRGAGAGVDAEVYLKTPDDGLYAIFRIQNKRLHESLVKLESKILDKVIGSWLSPELKAPWVEQHQGSTMIAGSAFGAFWELTEEQQQSLCTEAGVDRSLIKKMRPP